MGTDGKSPGRRAAVQVDLADMGTSSKVDDVNEENAEKDALTHEVEPRDLIEFGLIPEFVGKILFAHN